MDQILNIQNKKFDLETRTLAFAKRVNSFVRLIHKNIGNIENGKQLIRAAGSVGANYIEANEAISKKDFLFRIKICRKEAKESRYWLNLMDINEEHQQELAYLIQESTELMKIFGSIITKTETKF